ncbi:IucA/IucC family protein [Methylopila musalis]|uniref:IucA/IucC family protein n=1 Tax=Methylopila musalis TaxID=1134781 RepID=A0ABW3Z5S0_9HYPH
MTTLTKAELRDGSNARLTGAEARRLAEQAALQNVANCYVREIDPGAVVRHRPPGEVAADHLELPLRDQNGALRVEALALSACGPHRLGRAYIRRGEGQDWARVDPMTAVIALLHEAYRSFGPERAERLRGCELELLSRVLGSYQSAAACLAAGAGECDDDSFIAAEQSIAFGHWLHPTPKSLQGMTWWQRPAYQPEHGGRFRLTVFAAPAGLTRHASAAALSAPEIARAFLGADVDRLGLQDGEVPLLMHPLQAEALLLDPEVAGLRDRGALRMLGPAGPEVAATSSVRTLWTSERAWMPKFSLPVRITNSVRVNKRHELEAGVAVARLFAKTDWLQRHPRFRVIQDPAWITLDLPGRAESGFETIFRENPFVAGRDRGVATVAALTAPPLPGGRSRLERLVRDHAAQDGLRPAEAAKAWFRAYMDCAIAPPVALYDQLGVALEAHQQNTLLDVTGLLPRAAYYRDSQGFYLSNSHRHALDRVIPEAASIGALYFDDCEIAERFGYYLLVNQAFSVINRMGHDGLVSEAVLLDMLAERLERMARETPGVGGAFARAALDRPSIASKANLVTRLLDIDELDADDEAAVYARVDNPLFGRNGACDFGGDRAVAV